MSKRQHIDDTVEEILGILDEYPDRPPEAEARAALQRASNAGSSHARRQHLKAAQAHIARIKNPHRAQRLQAKALALQGRDGDTEIAHLTTGELVIPARMMTPELFNTLAAMACARGIDPRSLFVGSAHNRINPRTGLMEFADEQTLPPQDDIENITVTAPAVPALTDDDTHLLGRMIFTEGAPNWRTPGVMQALGSTALNRYGHPDYPNKSLQQIITDKHQFQGVGLMKNKEGHDTLWALSEHPEQLTGANANAFAEARRITRGLADGTLNDNTGGATRFGNRVDGSLPSPMQTDLDNGSYERSRPDMGIWTFLRKPRQ